MRSIDRSVHSRPVGRGFSLLETLVAVAIFSIAVVGIIEGIAASSRRQGWIEGESRAGMLAQNIMAELEHIGEYTVGTESGQFDGADALYTWTSEVAETDLEGLYEVRVIVAWGEGGAQRDFQLVTLLREQLYDEFLDYSETGANAFSTTRSQP